MVARQVHCLKRVGSIPAPATNTMRLLKDYFPIPLILFGGIMADVSRHLFDGIITIQIISWTSVVVGVIGLARIVWQVVRK